MSPSGTGRERRKEGALPVRKGTTMLELRPNCECCDRDLPPQADALICTYECTFCRDCAEHVLKGICPNCGGNLVTRPIRPKAKLAKDPASTVRKLRPGGCPSATPV
jgi:uncharacterized protein